MIEYRISPASRIGYFLAAALFVFGGIALLIASAHMTGQRSGSPFVIMAIIIIPIGWFFYREAAKLCLAIDEQSMTLTRAFSSREILLDEISGFRLGNKEVIYLDLKSGENPLTLPGSLERRKELLEWLRERYTDINAARVNEITESLLQDESIGFSREDREIRIKNARKIAVIGSVVSTLMILPILFQVGYAEFILPVLLVIPWIAVGLTWYYKGILRLYSTKANPYPSLFLAVCIPALAACLSAFSRYGIYLYEKPFWLSLAVLSVLVFLAWRVACGAAIAAEKNKAVVLAVLLLVTGVYSCGALIFTNCNFDRSAPQVWRVEVESKYYFHGSKSTYYHVELSSWGRFTDGQSITVPRSFYNEVFKGDSLSVNLRPGKWLVPWYEVTKQ
jgi:hypothetical protein